MADLTEFTITSIGNANLSVPRYQISGKVIDPKTGAIIKDFTGANAVIFPNILGTLTAAERLDFVRMVCSWLLEKSGILDQ